MPVGAVLGYLLAPGEAVPKEAPKVVPQDEREALREEVPSLAGVEAAEERAVRASPVARERGIDLARVRGTGPEGRITEADVLAYDSARGAATIGQSMALKLLSSSLA